VVTDLTTAVGEVFVVDAVGPRMVDVGK